MKLLLKILLPVLVFVACVFAAKTIVANRPEPTQRPNRPTMAVVEATRLALGQYPVVIRSQGVVQPTQANFLVPEVAGSITALAEEFVVGGEFQLGDVLVQIDERDYAIALTQAQANFAQVNARLQEEQALSEQAEADWNNLGRGGKASALTLRKPQLAAARANLAAARSQVDRAKLDLQRTGIVAPYNGRVLEKQVEVGQFVSRGVAIGRIHGISSIEVRLPLTSRQLTHLDIPLSTDSGTPLQPNVELLATVGGQEQRWTGKLIRVEGVDESTQQLNVIARINDPFATGQSPLRIGQFVQALVAGRVLNNVYVIPRSAVRGDNEVLILNDNNEIFRREVGIAWADEEVVAIDSGLDAQTLLVLTPMSTVTDGTPVRASIDGQAPQPLEATPIRRGKIGDDPKRGDRVKQ